MKKEFQIGDILRANFVGGIYHYLVVDIDKQSLTGEPAVGYARRAGGWTAPANNFVDETRYLVKLIDHLDSTSVQSISSLEPYFKDVEKVS